ncbi:DUF2306 domain-containing protein [Lysobacter silvisoli]|uniref:DUF2306 domain-containing protein n=1 Tax=Lysobacter silvisoli TaxID=2293254 RepID=A0A371K0B9_9GAMM|nr:DUF2306 domain-containing protein [Lysobacter silvisoli]RDZ27361.1 DUF2306 domain-containing protein [Lysobacter silvisoli]
MRQVWRGLRWLAALAFGLLCVAVAAYAFAFFYVRNASIGNPFDANFAVAGWAVPGHLFGGGLALLLAPLQLLTGLRRRWPRLHRLGGGLYAGGILVGAISALALAPQAQGGWASGSGFVLLALVWIGTTATGIRYALIGDYERHRRWMFRSVALTASAVTLRLMLGIGAAAMHWPFLAVYITAAWTCWTFNLAVCELLLRWPRRRARLDARRRLAALAR